MCFLFLLTLIFPQLALLLYNLHVDGIKRQFSNCDGFPHSFFTIVTKDYFTNKRFMMGLDLL